MNCILEKIINFKNYNNYSKISNYLEMKNGITYIFPENNNNEEEKDEEAFPVRAAWGRYARAVRNLLVSAGPLNASRIPPACGLEFEHFVRMIRWFSLAKPRFTTGSFLCSLPGANVRQTVMPREEVEEYEEEKDEKGEGQR